jgi:hypothetical protein
MYITYSERAFIENYMATLITCFFTQFLCHFSFVCSPAEFTLELFFGKYLAIHHSAIGPFSVRQHMIHSLIERS